MNPAGIVAFDDRPDRDGDITSLFPIGQLSFGQFNQRAELSDRKRFAATWRCMGALSPYKLEGNISLVSMSTAIRQFPSKETKQ